MTEAQAWKGKAVALGLLLLGVAGVIGALAGEDLLRLVHGVTRRQPVISAARDTAAALALVPMTTVLALVFLFAHQATPAEQRNPSRGALARARLLIAFVAGSLLLSCALPLAQHALVDHLATARGYVACPTPGWPRHQPDRWAVTPDRCPGEGADPNS